MNIYEKLMLKVMDVAEGKFALVASSDIVVEQRLALMCVNEKYSCRGYNKSANCPPNVEGPSLIRDILKKSQFSISIMLEVPESELFSEKRKKHMITLQKQVVAAEKAAVREGFINSRGFAGGSCKDQFCYGFDSCLALKEGICRNPDLARPSISGFGVDAAKLYEISGWDLSKEGMSWITGLVVLLK